MSAISDNGDYDDIKDNMNAQLVHRAKSILPGGEIVEMVIWRLPHPVAGSSHSYRYCLFFRRDGKRIVGFDNEREKGDHCHLDGKEYPYRFTSVNGLMADFLAEVRKRMPT